MNTSSCVIYTRVSESRSSDNSLSSQAQAAACKSFAEQKNPPWNVIKVFEEKPTSGKSMHNRPVLQEAIELCCQKKAILICYSLSRFARSIADSVITVDRLAKAGAGFVCLKEKFDTTDIYGKLLFHIFASLAEFERAQISERTSECMRHYMKLGRKMTSKPHYGYKFEGDKMVPDEKEQVVIRRAVRMRRDFGFSYRVICEQLANEGFKPRGKTFNVGTMRKVIQRHMQD